MKAKILLTLLLSYNFCLLSSQVPQGFNYQAIARDASGNPIINTALPVTITIQSDSLGGTIFWEELHSSVTTNGFGLFTLVIGKGARQASSTVANFSDIAWSVTPRFIKTQVFYKSQLVNMGSSRLWSVPFSMTAGDLSGPVDKLEVAGKTNQMDEALFEVKNKDGQTVFAVYNEGVRIYVNNEDSKGLKGGFAIGGFDKTKGENQDYFVVNQDSIRAYIDTNPEKGRKGGFAVGGFDKTKTSNEEYLRVTRDSTRIYLNNSETKGQKGGFAVGGFSTTKGSDSEYLSVTTDSVKVSKSLLIPRLTTQERDNLPFVPGEALIIFNLTEGCMQIYKNNVWSNIWCFNCAPGFIIQPVDKIICSGENAVFFVSATGTSLSYQWQESSDGGTTWNDISDGGSNPFYSGAKRYTLYLTNVPISYHTYKYRCVVAGSCLPNVTSNAVILNVGSTPPVIISQPTNQPLSVECTANFSISSLGYGVLYQWQQSADGGNTWGNISDGGTSPGFTGVTTTTLSLSNVPKAYFNYKYRCIVSNSCGGDATSAAATLISNSPPEITVQPVNKTVYAWQNTAFNMTASGSGLSYQWQESTNEGGTWSNITNGGSNPAYDGANTSELFLSNIQLTYNNYKYRCAVSNYCRPDSISDAATLSVKPSTLVTDIDGNNYIAIDIGSQLWMAENLKTTKYNDGTAIPLITDGAAWMNLSSPGYCWMDNDEATYKNTYGALYNWYTVNTGKLCPTGWHVPTDAEWTTLTDYLGGESVAGGKLKEYGTTHWVNPNTGATNETGFTALPGGNRTDDYGYFNFPGGSGDWWSTVEYSTWVARSRRMTAYYNFVDSTPEPKKYGHSVRCIKD
jgi:uncharacterized protein (TIGR02145 family)